MPVINNSAKEIDGQHTTQSFCFIKWKVGVKDRRTTVLSVLSATQALNRGKKIRAFLSVISRRYMIP